MTDHSFVFKAGISQHNAGNIRGQIPVTMHRSRQRIGQKRKANDQHHGKAGIAKMKATQCKTGCIGHRKTEYQTKANLRKNHQPGKALVVFALQHCNKNNRKHIGKRIVTATFHFQQGRRIIPQIQFTGTQHGKNGSRICRGYYCPHQKTQRPAAILYNMGT